MTKHFDADRFNSQSARAASRAVMETLNGLQKHTPEAQVAGAAITFSLLCDRFNVHPGTALASAQRMMTDKNTVEFDACRAYLVNEL